MCVLLGILSALLLSHCSNVGAVSEGVGVRPVDEFLTSLWCTIGVRFLLPGSALSSATSWRRSCRHALCSPHGLLGFSVQSCTLCVHWAFVCRLRSIKAGSCACWLQWFSGSGEAQRLPVYHLPFIPPAAVIHLLPVRPYPRWAAVSAGR